MSAPLPCTTLLLIDRREPESLGEEVVLADVLGEGENAFIFSAAVRVAGNLAKVGATEEIRFTDDAGCNSEGIDSHVELAVGRREEIFLKAAATSVPKTGPEGEG